MTARKRVFIADTGGTLGMKRTERGWAPAPGYLQELMAANPIFTDPTMPAYDIVELEPLLDSAEMTPRDWLRIAGEIADRYDDYDGFVVLHGTDTMAYTASALAFMLEGLAKPVILTGAQLPLCRARTDARGNLVTSLLIAAHQPIPEVCVYFHNRLHRGCRTKKVDCSGFDAFESPNLPPLGTSGIDLQINWGLVRPRPTGTGGLSVQERLDSSVGVLWLFPGITGQIVRNFLEPPLKGVVLQAFGVGNGPVGDREFVAALADANARGVVIVDCTQCLVGSVDLSGYATGSGLAGAGAVSGYDMTPEAALTKLAYLLGKDLPPEEVRRLVETDLRGELTASASDDGGIS